MKQGSTIFLRAIVLIIGLAILALCVFALPAGIRSDRTGLYRYILLGMYVPAIPFYIGLYQTLKLLGHIDRGRAFSSLAVSSLNVIKYCAGAIGVMYAAGLPFVYYVADKDDAPGVIVIALALVLAPFAVAVFAAVLQKLLQSAMQIKAENDLTV